MPIYEIEQYEVWASKVQIEAKDATEAIQKVLRSKGDPVDNSTEFIEMDDTRGMSVDMANLLKIDTTKIGGAVEWGVPTIRSIEQV